MWPAGVMKDDAPVLSPQLILGAYASGIFPMAESRDDPEIFWVDPRRRGILPLDGFHISRSLARRMRRGRFTERSPRPGCNRWARRWRRRLT